MIVLTVQNIYIFNWVYIDNWDDVIIWLCRVKGEHYELA